MKLAFIVLVLPLAFCLGCGPGWVIEPAPIDDVMVELTGLPMVTVYIKGGLPNSCYQLDGITVNKRLGDTIPISVTIKRPDDDRACAEIYGSFEKTVDLGEQFIPGKTYTLKVNDYTTSFTMPG